MVKILRVLGVVLLWLAQMVPAYAKCASEDYLIKGVVNDLQTRKPVENARIFIFFDDAFSDADSLGDDPKRYPDSVATSGQGTFEAPSRFSTWKTMSLSGDVCGRKLHKLELLVVREGYRAQRELFPMRPFPSKELRIFDEQGTTVIELLKPIYLRPGLSGEAVK